MENRANRVVISCGVVLGTGLTILSVILIAAVLIGLLGN